MIWLGHFIFSKFNPQNIDNFHRKKFSILWFWSLGENLISGDFVAEARIALLNHYEGVGMGKFVHHYHNQESTYINTWFICIRITIVQSSCYLASKDVGEKKPEATNNRFPWNFHRPATDGIKLIIIRIKQCFLMYIYIFNVYICRGNWDAVGIVRRRKKCLKSKNTHLLVLSCTVCYQVYDVYVLCQNLITIEKKSGKIKVIENVVNRGM